VSGHKIGGDIDNAIVLFPDPMGATGSTIAEAIDMYKTRGKARKFVALHCIVTPEYLKKVQAKHPDLIIYAVRLDRGLSDIKILDTIPGTHWDQERGLNDKHYIVPGGGGFGEILNNAYV
jgi:uracil phosphoribosyltransferase